MQTFYYFNQALNGLKSVILNEIQNIAYNVTLGCLKTAVLATSNKFFKRKNITYYFLALSLITQLIVIQANGKSQNIVGQTSLCMTCPTGSVCSHRPCRDNICNICCAGDRDFFLGDCADCACPAESFENSICIAPNAEQTLPINNFDVTVNNLQNLTCSLARTIFIPRSQGSNAARQIVGWQQFFHKPVPNNQLLVTGHTVGYSQSFRAERIANYLFGTSQLTFTGSEVTDRTRCQFLADNFGLCPNFVGTLSIEPKIQNIIFENQFFFSLNCITPGLYAIANFPLVNTRWSLGLCPQGQITICDKFAPCTVSKNSATGTNNLLQALGGSFLFGDMLTPIKFGKITDQTLTYTNLANFNLIIGYDIHQDPKYFYGFFLEFIAPTGNKPNARYLFEPIVGNGHHWELGGGVTGNLPIWSNGIDENLLLYIDAHVTHMFKSRQCRSFDFCSRGPFSRYNLLQQFDQSGIYTGQLINGINFTTRPVDVSRTVKGDVVFKIAYYNPCLSLDVGYNFYGHTGEKLCLVKTDFDKYRYTFKRADICKNNKANNFLNDSDLFLESGISPATVTHKLFAYLDYYFYDRPDICKRYILYIGIGAEIEVNGLACNEQNNSLNQWGIWLKGGLSF